MNNLVLVILIIIVLLVVYYIYRNGNSPEEFDGAFYTNDPDNQQITPIFRRIPGTVRKGQQSFQDQINMSGFAGLSASPTFRDKVMQAEYPTYEDDGDDSTYGPTKPSPYDKYNRKVRKYKSKNDTFVVENEPQPQVWEDKNPNDDGIKQYRLDLLPCSKQCCGADWTVPFDGLTSGQVMRAIREQEGKTPIVEMKMADGTYTKFVRSSYTCGGATDAGCPCIPVNAYKFYANRGNNTQVLDHPDPTFIIRAGMNKYADDELLADQVTPYQQYEGQYSSFSNTRKLNDFAKQTPDAQLEFVSGVPSDF